MTTTRPFRFDDLFKFNNINLDVLTETYQTSFYYQYLARWPEYFKVQASCSSWVYIHKSSLPIEQVQEAPCGRLMGYVMGKSEGRGQLW
jgi:N-terminal acetyltransferase B complex catalytic subunit